MDAGELIVRLKADLANFQVGMAKAASTVRAFASDALLPLRLVQGALSSVFNVRNLLVGGALGMLVSKVVAVGATAEQSESKFNMAFGDMSDSVRDWSEQMGAQLGRSGDDIRGIAADLYLFMENTGLARDAAVSLTEQITQVSYAIQKTRGLDPAGTAWAIQMAMMGNMRAMRAYGVQINEAKLQEWALSQGVDDNVKSWTQAQLSVGRLGATLQQLKKDQDAAVTSQGGINWLIAQSKDAFKDLEIEIFSKWRPAIETYFTELRDWLKNNKDDIATWAGKLGEAALAIIKALKSVVEFLVTDWQNGWQDTGKAVNLIVQAMVDDIGIILHDGIIVIGKNILPWMIEGSRSIGISGFKAFGTDIAETFSKGVIAAINLIPGISIDTKQLEENLGKLRGTGGTTANTLEKIANRTKELTQELSKLSAASPNTWGQDQVTALDLFYGYTEKAAEGVKDVTNAAKKLHDGVDEVKKAFADLAQKSQNFGQGWGLAMKEMGANMISVGKMAYDLAKGIQTGLVDALSQAVFHAKTLSEAFREMGLQIAEMMFKEAMMNVVGAAMGGGTSLVGKLLGERRGGVFGPSGIIPFGAGGVVDHATLFPFARGIGVMGERGKEAVMPLERDVAGRLGVRAAGGQTEALLGQSVSLLQEIARKNLQVQATVVDYRNVITKERMQGREGEHLVMYHVGRNR